MVTSAESKNLFEVTAAARTEELFNRRKLIKNYLTEHEPEFARLYKLQQEGWNRKSGDTYFTQRRKAADTASSKVQWGFFKLMQKIGLEMNDATAALSLDHSTTSPKRVLDLCSAPGGYSTEILRLNPSATIDAISLPAEDGGHRVLIPFGTRDPRVQYLFTDITMLATEYGVDINEIPADHPDAGKFKRLRPYKGKEYDLVFCDGQVLRTHERESYRESCEATRLTNAQLILGLQRIKEGGTFVILLHRLDSWDSVMLVRSFCMFADIQLFKPVKAHAMVSSFYMVAKNVQLENGEVRVAVEGFRERWYKATFETDSPREVVREEDVAAVLEEFGPRLVELGRGIWKVQADALEKAPFMKDGVGGEEGGEVDDAGGRGPSTLARVE